MKKKHPSCLAKGKKIDMSDVASDPVVQFFDRLISPLRIIWIEIKNQVVLQEFCGDEDAVLLRVSNVGDKIWLGRGLVCGILWEHRQVRFNFERHLGHQQLCAHLWRPPLWQVSNILVHHNNYLMICPHLRILILIHKSTQVIILAYTHLEIIRSTRNAKGFIFLHQFCVYK